MRIVYFGTPQFSADILSALVADPEITVVGVVCQPDEPIGRKRVLTAPPTKQFAIAHDIPVLQPTKLRDEAFLAAIDAFNADVAVIVAYGRILPKALLDRIPKGFVNVHPSLLPKYRGPSPMQAAIAAGDLETGVSIMTIDEGMDTGPLLAQTTIALAPNETTASLTEKVVTVAAPLLITSLKGFVAGSLTPAAQHSEGVSICKMLSREDGKIDWTESAAVIDQKVRAYTPWPGTWTTWALHGNETVVKILSGAPSPDTRLPTPDCRPCAFNGRLFCMTADVPFELFTLQPAGGKAMSAADFIRGYLKK
jgi:methionyl-tRNA formyltransferase